MRRVPHGKTRTARSDDGFPSPSADSTSMFHFAEIAAPTNFTAANEHAICAKDPAQHAAPEVGSASYQQQGQMPVLNAIMPPSQNMFKATVACFPVNNPPPGSNVRLLIHARAISRVWPVALRGIRAVVHGRRVHCIEFVPPAHPAGAAFPALLLCVLFPAGQAPSVEDLVDLQKATA